MSHPNLLVGIEHIDDAGVFKIRDDLALVQTVDFFTPIVDDPYTFGQIAAANALSDVYAMGGVPITAMNLVAFPIHAMEIEVLREILKGGLDKMREAEVVLVGGHSIEDQELKYGLAVTGLIHPDAILTNTGAVAGDWIILTKPLGTGIINTAQKGGMAAPEAVQKAIEVMTELNRKAAEVMKGFRVHACTDVTGFGLLGHLSEMLGAGKIGIKIALDAVPILPQAEEYAGMGLVPGGARRNREFYAPKVQGAKGCTPSLLDILYDPQTSGGLLIAVAEEDAEGILRFLQEVGVKDARTIAEVVAKPKGRLILS
ncbi:MAG: selenide, water dikinase SelD [Deltaproteobacteria bacterium RBG_16_54_11]|jgi:selenide,water dikinase|nr:MAG: selenide, water dikinase SelD [Deltaproteobacteria bacterium RBG_16_54_11]